MKKEEDDFVSGTFTWNIGQFSKLDAVQHYSEVFVVGGFKWQISIFPKGNNTKEYLSMYLHAGDSSTLTSGLSRHVKFSLTVVNQLDRNKSIKTSTYKDFRDVPGGWGFREFMFLSEIRDLSKGYLVNDNVIVEAEVSVRKGDIRFLEKETGDLIDFKGLGRIELAFHPLLEEVCLSHPSLIECQQKRSRKFVECAFTTLGRLLHFLKTEKVRDLNQDGYESLQHLWEELETFKLDLVWLQPHVESVFGTQNMAGRVQRMREDVNIFENEIKNRRAILAAAEVDFERVKGVLMKAEQEFKWGHVDSVIGYPLA
ncbi:hypothetical protein M0R45_036248 [Rubus argutus]|uniref:MATH domain-containing protein n=1 Tax=Rubus argutus TaxID=59490 RepID=A0AAW1VZ79_RUBAR